MFIPLELRVRRSRIHAALLASAAGLALVAIAWAALPVWLRLVLAGAVLAGTGQNWREAARGADGLRVSRGGQIQLGRRAWQDAVLVGQPVVLPWLIRMNLVQADGRRVTLLLWPDSADANALRKLRTWLKWGRHPAGLDVSGSRARS